MKKKKLTRYLGPLIYTVGLTAVLSSGLYDDAARSVIQATTGILMIMLSMRITPIVIR